jgi:hypothetical protein
MDSNLLTPNNTTEPDAVALVAGMRARGIRFEVNLRRGVPRVVLRPYHLVTDEDRVALGKPGRWHEVRAIVLSEEEEWTSAASPSPSPVSAEPGAAVGMTNGIALGPTPGPISPSVPAEPSPAGSPEPTDDVWFDTRNGQRVPIARFDLKKMNDFLELVRRSAERGTFGDY